MGTDDKRLAESMTYCTWPASMSKIKLDLKPERSRS
jgi:hypothetical protein